MKHKLSFFLDYGCCFWGIGEADAIFCGCVMPEDLPISLETLQEINKFLSEYDASYDCGCPPYEGWTVADCKRFNSEYRRILNLALPELKDEFIVCIEQYDLMEDEELLAELYRRGREFFDERFHLYHSPEDL